MRFLSALRLGAGLRRHLADERGTTLSELLTVMAILGIVLAGLTSVFVSASHAEIDMTNRFDAQQQALFALDKLRREIHCASSVTDTSGSAVTSWTSAKSGLVLTLPSYCATGQGSVAWCARASGSAWDLYRIGGSTCPGSGGVKVAYSLWTTGWTGQPFSNPTSQPTTAHLATLHVQFPVNVKPGSSIGTYSLADDLVLRNSIRQ